MGAGCSSNNGEKAIRYNLLNVLGRGSFGIVYRATLKEDKRKNARVQKGAEMACKVIDKTKLSPQESLLVAEEVEIMRKLDHPACITLLDYFETPEKHYMVLDMCVGGELFDRITESGSFSEKQASELIRTMADGLVYIHNNGIAHRDLKPENLLYCTKAPNSPLKITDFGLAKQMKPGVPMKTAAGTPGYVAPEVLVAKGYGKEVDWWSLGVILYIVLCGFPPFYHESTPALFKLIKRGDFQFPNPYWSKISADAKDLVKRLLTVDVKLRATGADVLSHKWLGGNADATALGDGYKDRIRLMQAKKKFRKFVKVVCAINIFLGEEMQTRPKIEKSTTFQKGVQAMALMDSNE